MSNSNHKFVIIGSSTGGPSLLEKIVSALSYETKISLIIVQHMQKFSLISFAKRLDRLCKLDVVLVDSNQIIEPCKVYILLQSTKIISNKFGFSFVLVDDNTFYNPSIDIFFKSIKILKGYEVYVYILTGIGQDGVLGLKELKNIAIRVAQDKKSSIVFGMPKAAYEAGVIESVKNIDEIIDDIKNI